MSLKKIENEITFFHLITTTDCNFSCRYCVEKGFKENEFFWSKFSFIEQPTRPKYSLMQLKTWLNYRKPYGIIFYGGEPLLNTDFIKDSISFLDADAFVLQTNGSKLNELDGFSNMFETIFVSIDGRKEITEFNRGKGNYDLVLRNVKLLRNEFNNELVARMTVDENTNIFKEVKHLISLGYFDSIHWQIDAGFYNFEVMERKKSFPEWVFGNYLPNLEKLLDYWVDLLEKGKLVRLYPFVGIYRMLIYNERFVAPPCGAGKKNFAIAPNGDVFSCPISINLKDFKVGSIYEKELKTQEVDKSCKNCRYFSVCGGRCLYSSLTKPWESYWGLPCIATIKTIDILKNRKDMLEEIIEKNKEVEKVFFFRKYNGAEIIP